MSDKKYARVSEVDYFDGSKVMALELDVRLLKEMNFVDKEILEVILDKPNKIITLKSTNTISL